jgi:hypothetical protein
MSTAPPRIQTEWGYTTESSRQQAVVNMKLDPTKRQQVLELLCQQLGSVAKGEIEFRRRYPELFEEDGDV